MMDEIDLANQLKPLHLVSYVLRNHSIQVSMKDAFVFECDFKAKQMLYIKPYGSLNNVEIKTLLLALKLVSEYMEGDK